MSCFCDNCDAATPDSCKCGKVELYNRAIKAERENKRLKDGISYALVQQDLDYGMTESKATQFRIRKVFSILLDLTDGK